MSPQRSGPPPVEELRCAVCEQEFTRASHYTYVRGQRVCRDNEECIAAAAITGEDRRRIALEQRKLREMANYRQRWAGGSR